MRASMLRPNVLKAWRRIQPDERELRAITQADFRTILNTLCPAPPACKPTTERGHNQYGHGSHWHSAFPSVFNGSEPGFHAVIGNPPFGSTIDGPSTQPLSIKSWWKFIVLEVTVGTFDKASLFLHLAIDLIAQNGRYGLFLARSILPGGRSAAALQHYVNDTPCPSTFYLFEDSRLFDGANVLVCAVSGGTDEPCDEIEVHHNHDDPKPKRIRRTAKNWWHMITSHQSEHRSQTDQKAKMVSLSDYFSVSAGCATGAAYELSTYVSDEEVGDGLKLITTSLIDRFVFNWGPQTARFLKLKSAYPRWLTDSPTSGVKRAAARQRRPRILVDGLTKNARSSL